MTRKQAVSDTGGLRGQAVYVARQVGPLASKTAPMAQQAAQQVMPLARSAGASMRQGADEAVAWATPLVDAARSWAAPQLEQSAQAINENLAPIISSALITAARKIDTKPKKSRGRRGLLAGTMLLTLAGGIAAMLVLRHRNESAGFPSAPPGDSPDIGSVDGGGQSGTDGHGTGSEPPDADMNGHPRIV
jgi:hypothetical protein